LADANGGIIRVGRDAEAEAGGKSQHRPVFCQHEALHLAQPALYRCPDELAPVAQAEVEISETGILGSSLASSSKSVDSQPVREHVAGCVRMNNHAIMACRR